MPPQKFPEDTLVQGDVLATNDPEIGTGHLPDVTMITPIFKKGKIVAYAGSIAHLPDIGGRPLHSEANDIFEEGIRFPIVKLHKAGVPNADVLDIIAASVRLPTEVLGDLESMVAANRVMGRELLAFLDGNLGLNLLSSSPESGLIHALVRALPGSEKHCEEPFGGRR
jgi:N-methylhydantoinase B